MTGKIKKILAITVGLIAGLLFLVHGYKELSHSQQLKARGQVTTGEVLDAEDHVSGRLHWHAYYLEVRFQPNHGETCQPRVKVSDEVYETATIGGSVPVHYLPEDPANCQVGPAVELRYGNLLWGIGCLLGAGYLLVFFAQPADEKEAAERINESFKTLELSQYEYASANAKNFTHLDLAYYDRTQHQLEALGYRFLADEENVTLRQRTGVRVFNRLLLSSDQTTMTELYHFIPKFTLRMLGAKPVKVLGFETWFSDGCFVVTNNAELSGKLDSPPAIDALRLPAGTGCDLLLPAHQRRVARHLAGHPGVTPVKIAGLAGYRKAQDEQQRIKSEFRKRVGLTKAELERFAEGKDVAVDRLHDAITEQRQREGNSR